MADHNELVSEMTLLEQMGTQERQKLARKRRSQQIKKWTQREKEWLAKERQLSKKLATNNSINQLATISNNETTTTNGLNLKNYTTFSSNHDNLDAAQTHLQANDGRVHFDNGVMLLEAAARNDIDEVRRLLKLGVSADSTNHDGLTALHQCCVDAFEPMMKLLVEFGANVNAKDSEQWTPLHAACTCNHPNIVKYLVKSGADLLAVNGDGNMPFDICEDEATLDHIESEMVKRNITQEIIDYTRASTEIKMLKDLQAYISDGGDINAKGIDGITQLHIASANGYTSVVKYLIDHGADVDTRDTDHWTPLHGAACWGHLQHAKVIELLVQAGADINAKTMNGEAPLDICDNPEIRDHLVKLKDEIETKHASTTSNLRRTQSRNNSRTHSVRRTSIREKAQISRREAREEALLRQETNPSQNNSDEDSNAIGDNSSSAKLQSTIVVNGGKKENSTISENLDGKISKAFTTLDLPLQKITKDENQNNKSLSNGEDISIENNVNRKIDATYSNKTTNLDSSNKMNCNTLDVSSNNTQQTTPITAIATSRVNMNGFSKDDDDKPLTMMNGHDDSVRCEDSHSKSIETNTAQNNSQLQSLTNQISPQSSLVFASINCTLSDLKKQRSDLRHRNMNMPVSLSETTDRSQSDLKQFHNQQSSDVPDSSTLSTASLNDEYIGTNSAELDHQRSKFITSRTSLVADKSVVLDPALSYKTQANGFLKRDLPPPSPNQALRKFRGDPSEVVGGKERYRSRRCCILL